MTQPKDRITTATVVRTTRPTPHLVRVVLGGPELAGLPIGEFTDHYVKLLFPYPGTELPEPFDLDAVRRDLPRERWPRLRAYTVRAFDPAAAELTIDVVHHGEQGLGGPWAAAARPGDRVLFRGPGGAYAPDPAADWHLLVGDESALPAIAASLERLPAGADARVFVEVSGPAEEQPLATAADARVVWLHRGVRPVGAALVDAVRALQFPAGVVHAFVHGEAGFVRQLRRFLRVERGVPVDRLSISGYWRLGVDDEGWRAAKAEWKRQVEVDELTPTARP
jgi:NADPH-dependent ferric siderophore reductase